MIPDYRSALTAAGIRSSLKTHVLGRALHVHQEVESTNQVAMALAQAGAADGTTAGMGVFRQMTTGCGSTAGMFHALDEAGADERLGRRRQPAERGRGGEAGDADQEEPAAPEDVAEPAAGHHQDGEGQRVGIDGPLEA